jgi:hypothetical protein
VASRSRPWNGTAPQGSPPRRGGGKPRRFRHPFGVQLMGRGFATGGPPLRGGPPVAILPHPFGMKSRPGVAGLRRRPCVTPNTHPAEACGKDRSAEADHPRAEADQPGATPARPGEWGEAPTGAAVLACWDSHAADDDALRRSPARARGSDSASSRARFGGRRRRAPRPCRPLLSVGYRLSAGVLGRYRAQPLLIVRLGRSLALRDGRYPPRRAGRARHGESSTRTLPSCGPDSAAQPAR